MQTLIGKMVSALFVIAALGLLVYWLATKIAGLFKNPSDYLSGASATSSLGADLYTFFNPANPLTNSAASTIPVDDQINIGENIDSNSQAIKTCRVLRSLGRVRPGDFCDKLLGRVNPPP